MTEPQPLDLTAFLATAEYAIVQAPKDVTDETGESLRSAGTYYAPKLLAAVKAVLTRHAEWEIHDGDYGEGPLLYSICKECCAARGGGQTEECAVGHERADCWPCATVLDISRELLGKGE